MASVAITAPLLFTFFSFILPPLLVCRFGGILLHADRFKHINNVARILLHETGLGLKVYSYTAAAQHAMENRVHVWYTVADIIMVSIM